MASDLRDPPSTLLPFLAETPPLRVEEGGVIRVGKSRVSLDLVVEQYNNGMAPEEMVRAYDTLTLLDVHAVIAYYLGHRDEVHSYLSKRAEDAAKLQGNIESARPRISSDDLLNRRNVREQGHAATG